MTSVFSLLKSSMIVSTANYQLTDANQGLRNAQEFLNRDLLVTGDGVKGTPNIWLPTAFVTKYITVRPASELDPTNIGYVNIGSVISDNNLPAGTEVFDSPEPTYVKEHTDRITLLAVDNSFTPKNVPVGSTWYPDGRMWLAEGFDDVSVGEIYYLTSGGTGTFGTVTGKHVSGDWAVRWGDGDSYGLNRTGWSGNVATATTYGSVAATFLRIRIIQYFVDTEGHLIRRVFGVKGAGHIDNVIAEHLTDLQFKYFLKPLTNGANIYDQPIDQVQIAQKDFVRLIEPSLGVETSEVLQDGFTHQVEGTTQLGIRNLQFLEAAIPKDYDGNTALPYVGPTPYVTPTPTPTPIPTPTPLPTATPTPPPPTPTPPPGTPTPTPSPTATPPPTPTPTPPPTPPPTPTPTPTPSNIDG